MRNKMKNIILFSFLVIATIGNAQNSEIILTNGDNEITFTAALGNPNIRTITFKTDIVITGNILIDSTKVLNFTNNNKIIINKVSAGSLEFNHAIIHSDKFEIVAFQNFHNVNDYVDLISRVTGKIKNDIVYPEWFGGDSLERWENRTIHGENRLVNVGAAEDDAYAIQMAINVASDKVKLSEGKYRIYHTLKKERVDDIDIAGVRLIGSGVKKTAVLVMKSINFIELKGKDGHDSHKPITNSLFSDFRLSGQDVGLNGFYFYSSIYNTISNVEIHHFKESGILFDGNPNENPDRTASFLTKIELCNIRSNKIGVYSKLNNVSPQLELISSQVNHNFRAGIVWNSSYFHSINSSISFNGRSIQEHPNIDSTPDFPLGGFYNEVQNNYGDLHFYDPYYSKGIVLEATEFDGNYPSAITLKSSIDAIIKNNALQQQDVSLKNFKFTNKGLIHVGGDEIKSYNVYDSNGNFLKIGKYRELSRFTTIENNRISYYRMHISPMVIAGETIEASIIENDACIIRASTWGLFTKIKNNCFEDNTGGNSKLGTDYKYIKEYNRTIFTNSHPSASIEDSYIKLFDDECIDPSKLDIANDLFLSKFNKPNRKDYGHLFLYNEEKIIKVPSIKAKNGVEVKGGSFIVSSNDPGAISGLFFYRAINSPQIHAAYSSQNISITTSNVGVVPIDDPGKFNICVFNDGTIRLKSSYQSPIYVTISFLEKIGMYTQ